LSSGNTKNVFRKLAYNVLAVCDVFTVAIKEREAFQQPQKCGGEKPTKGASPTGFFVARAANGGEAHTVLLHDDFFTPHDDRRLPWRANGVEYFLYYLFHKN
jgi:hypothetical protein